MELMDLENTTQIESMDRPEHMSHEHMGHEHMGHAEHMGHEHMSAHQHAGHELFKVDFIGHFVPGLTFTFLGSWFTYCLFLRYFLCLKEEQSGRKSARKYENSLFFGWSRFPGVPVDAIVSLVASTPGLLLLLHNFTLISYMLHNLLFFSFAMVAFIEILSVYNPMIPKYSGNFALILTCWSNISLLYAHSVHHTGLALAVHMKLMIILFLSGIFVIFESVQNRNILPALGRAYCGILMGVWYISIGEVLAPFTHPKFYGDDMKSVMTIEILFVIEMFGALCLSMILGTIAYFKVKRMSFTRVSAALDIEYLIVKVKPDFGPSKKLMSNTDGSFEPLLSSEGDSDPASCC